MPDLNANDIEAAMEIVAGTARSMGVRIEGREMKKKYVPSRKVARDASGQGRRLSLIQQWKGEKRPPLPRKEMQ